MVDGYVDGYVDSYVDGYPSQEGAVRASESALSANPSGSSSWREDDDSLAHALNLPRDVRLSSLPMQPFACVTPDLLRLPASLRGAAPKRQREFLAGRDCAQQALSVAGCPAGPALPMGPDRLPVWPTDWLGSISHCATMACALVAPKTCYKALGVDVECIMSEDLSTALGAMIATESELTHFSALGRPLGVTLLFSAKEALFKALYPDVRRVLDFDAARLRYVTAHAMALELTSDWSNTWRAGSVLAVRFAVRGTLVYTAVLSR
jgi:enterobactin synthetase component D